MLLVGTQIASAARALHVFNAVAHAVLLLRLRMRTPRSLCCVTRHETATFCASRAERAVWGWLLRVVYGFWVCFAEAMRACARICALVCAAHICVVLTTQRERETPAHAPPNALRV